MPVKFENHCSKECFIISDYAPGKMLGRKSTSNFILENFEKKKIFSVPVAPTLHPSSVGQARELHGRSKHPTAPSRLQGNSELHFP